MQALGSIPEPDCFLLLVWNRCQPLTHATVKATVVSVPRGARHHPHHATCATRVPMIRLAAARTVGAHVRRRRCGITTEHAAWASPLLRRPRRLALLPHLSQMAGITDPEPAAVSGLEQRNATAATGRCLREFPPARTVVLGVMGRRKVERHIEPRRQRIAPCARPLGFRPWGDLPVKEAQIAAVLKAGQKDWRVALRRSGDCEERQ